MCAQTCHLPKASTCRLRISVLEPQEASDPEVTSWEVDSWLQRWSSAQKCRRRMGGEGSCLI